MLKSHDWVPDGQLLNALMIGRTSKRTSPVWCYTFDMNDKSKKTARLQNPKKKKNAQEDTHDHTEESRINDDETEDNSSYGGIPSRDLKKNLGCGG